MPITRKTNEKRDLKTIERELGETTHALTELRYEQAGIADRLKIEALKAVQDSGKGTAGLTKALQRVHALPHLLWALELYRARLSEERRCARLAWLEQESKPLEEVVRRAEAERNHALYTSNYNARLEAEAEIKEAMEKPLPMGEEKSELHRAEKSSKGRIRYLEQNGPEA